MRFAREEIARRTPELSSWQLRRHRTGVASVAAIVADNLVQPEVYASVGLDPKEAKAAARANTHYGDKLRDAVDRAGRLPAGRRPGRRRVRAALEARPPGLRGGPRRGVALSPTQGPLGELGRVEADRGGRGQVEALGPAAHRDPHPGVGERASSPGTPRASLPNSHSTGPASSVAELVQRRLSPAVGGQHGHAGRLQRRDQRGRAARLGRRRRGRGCPRWPAPPCRRTGRPSPRRTPRRRRRTRPPSAGSCRRCRGRPARTARRPAAAARAVSVSAATSRSAQTATSPWGVTVSESPAAAFSVSSRTGTAVAASRSRWAAAAASVAKTSRTPEGSASASATACRPSARNRPAASRPARRVSLRAATIRAGPLGEQIGHGRPFRTDSDAAGADPGGPVTDGVGGLRA